MDAYRGGGLPFCEWCVLVGVVAIPTKEVMILPWVLEVQKIEQLLHYIYEGSNIFPFPL